MSFPFLFVRFRTVLESQKTQQRLKRDSCDILSTVELFVKTMTSQRESQCRSEHTLLYENEQKERKMT